MKHHYLYNTLYLCTLLSTIPTCNPTLLHNAIKSGNAKEVKKILASKASPTQADENNVCPIDLATNLKQNDILLYLLDAIDAIEEEKEKAKKKAHTPTSNHNNHPPSNPHTQKRKLKQTSVPYHFSAPPLPVTISSIQSNYPLHDAIQNDDIACLYRLLKEGCNVNTKNENNESAIDLAISLEYTEMVALMIGYNIARNQNNDDNNNQSSEASPPRKRQKTQLLPPRKRKKNNLTSEPQVISYENGYSLAHCPHCYFASFSQQLIFEHIYEKHQI